ncbi:hypothetical protein Tco_0904248 [Tanacetum coccineum]
MSSSALEALWKSILCCQIMQALLLLLIPSSSGILLQNMEILGVLQDVAADPTLPCRKAVRCALYGHGEAIFFQVTALSLPNINHLRIIT